jgi:hypothetical protein
MITHEIKENINLSVETNIPAEQLPAVTCNMLRIHLPPFVHILCETKYYGHSNMMKVNKFYKQLIIV